MSMLAPTYGQILRYFGHLLGENQIVRVAKNRTVHIQNFLVICNDFRLEIKGLEES